MLRRRTASASEELISLLAMPLRLGQHAEYVHNAAAGPCVETVSLCCSRIISWRDRVMYDDYAVNAEEPIVYKRTAG